MLCVSFLLLAATPSSAQNLKLSEYATISVLTCDPGTDLYAVFGHTAIRVKDPMLRLDLIYNYGIFDYNAPGFYINFVKGKLTYSLGRQYFSDFIFAYEMEQRTVKEQTLQLSVSERSTFFNFLEYNYRPENRDYQYDFFYDNCATKIRDLIENTSLLPQVTKQVAAGQKKTFRTLLGENLKPNSWPSLGINLALGALVDTPQETDKYVFLPKYLSEHLKHYEIRGTPLVLKRNIIFQAKKERKKETPLWATPLFWSVLILIVYMVISTYQKFTGKQCKWADFILFTGSGSIGLLLVFLWGFTEHRPMVLNFNILWASPLCFAVIWALVKNPTITKKMGGFMMLSLLAALIVHLLGVQKIDVLFFPIIAALFLRSLPLWQCNKLRI